MKGKKVFFGIVIAFMAGIACAAGIFRLLDGNSYDLKKSGVFYDNVSNCATGYLYRIADCIVVPIRQLSDLSDGSPSYEWMQPFENELSGEEELLAIMQTTAGQLLENYVYVDMDHDGSKELIGVYPDNMGVYQTWYCSSDGETCFLVLQNNECMDACKIELLDLKDATHVVINTYCLMGTVKDYSILSLKGKDISCLASNKYGYVRMTENGDITLNIEAYDGIYDPESGGMIAHTWKDTYLYFDGETYKEYGAKEITETEFLSYKNAQNIKDTIAGELRQSDTTKLEYIYFIRENNIIHIQCNVYNSAGLVQYGYYTVRFSGDVLNEQSGQYTMGQMAPSFSDWDVKIR